VTIAEPFVGASVLPIGKRAIMNGERNALTRRVAAAADAALNCGSVSDGHVVQCHLTYY